MFRFILFFLVIAGCGSRQLLFFEEDAPVHKPLAEKQVVSLYESANASLNLKELNSENEQIKAKIPLIISGSKLSCAAKADNKKILLCSYPESIGLKVNPDDILVATGKKLIGIVLETDPANHKLSIVFSSDIAAGAAISLELEKETPKKENKPIEVAKSLPNLTNKKSMDYSSLLFTPDLNYMDYPQFNVENGSGFVNKLDLVTFLSGGKASLSCFENVTQKLLYASKEIRLKRGTDLFSANLRSIDFIDGLDTVAFKDIANTYCEVTIKFVPNIREIGVYLETTVQEEYAFKGTVLLDELGIDASKIEPKSFVNNISCFQACDPKTEDCGCE